MRLKQAILEQLGRDALKEICDELGVEEVDRRSVQDMRAALSRTRRARPEDLIESLYEPDVKAVAERMGVDASGRRAAIVERLLDGAGAAGGDGAAARGGGQRAGKRGSKRGTRKMSTGVAEETQQYRHRDEAVQRPDVGVQDQFRARRPPKTYRYDSSLDPALSWDEQRERDLGEWLLGLIERAAKEGEDEVFAEPQDWKGGGVRVRSTIEAVETLRSISKPFLNWAGKAERHEIEVPTLPLFVHERHSTKAILDGIRHRKAKGLSLDLFGDPEMDIRDRLEAYEHKGPWQNRMILGDSLQVMNSLLEYEGLGGHVQMIYMDPPYGVKFGSNFQPFVKARDVRDGNDDDMIREPEMVKAFRDTWEVGLHSYLAYLRDRLSICRELLSLSGSLFVQISDANVHHVREVLDEIFGSENFVTSIIFQKTSSEETNGLPNTADYVLWYARELRSMRYKPLYRPKRPGEEGAKQYVYSRSPDYKEVRKMTRQEIADPTLLPEGWKVCRRGFPLTSQHYSPTRTIGFDFEGKTYHPGPNRQWSLDPKESLPKLTKRGMLYSTGKSLNAVMDLEYMPGTEIGNTWTDTGTGSFTEDQIFVVQTSEKVVQRCMLMTTEPGDLVADPTCGSGTTAFVAECWGRRWITIDASRVPLTLARQRLLTACFPWFELRDPSLGPRGGFQYRSKENSRNRASEGYGIAFHHTLSSLAGETEPTPIVFLDQPERDNRVIRVTGLRHPLISNVR